jgi:hypothetical protein
MIIRLTNRKEMYEITRTINLSPVFPVNWVQLQGSPSLFVAAKMMLDD